MSKREPTQLDLIKKKGGVRKGAGRKKILAKDIQNHIPRGRVTGKHPLHVNFKLSDGLMCLRHKDVFNAFKEAVRAARQAGLRVNHFAILRNHGHMIVEVENNFELTRLMKIVTIRLALRIKKLSLASGRAFRDRYFLHILKTPTEVKHALKYVLLNEVKHMGNHLNSIRTIKLNAFCSAYSFQNWKNLLGRVISIRGNNSYSIDVSPPKTWLLQQGWMRA